MNLWREIRPNIPPQALNNPIHPHWSVEPIHIFQRGNMITVRVQENVYTLEIDATPKGEKNSHE